MQPRTQRTGRDRQGCHWAGRLIAQLLPLALGVTLVISVNGCREYPTGPRLTGIDLDDQPRRTVNPPFGAENSPDKGTFIGKIDSVWGNAPADLVGYFPTPTIVVIGISGIVTQGGAALPAPSPPPKWGPRGEALVQGYSGVAGWAAVGFQIGSLVSSQNFWPSDTTNNSVLMGSKTYLAGLRGEVWGAQPTGDATHCGYGRTPPLWCYSYSGTATMTFTRPTAKLTLAATGPTTVPKGTLVTFSAGVLPATINNIATPMSQLTFGWTPDVKLLGDSVVCESTVASSCQKRMLTSGTMFALAYANGHHEMHSVHVQVDDDPQRDRLRCEDVPGLASQHPELANPVMDSVFKRLWEQSNSRDRSVLQEFRREQGGFILRNNDQYSFQPFAATPESCSIDVTGLVKPDSAIATAHTHPWQLLEKMTACGPAKDGNGNVLYEPNGDPLYARYLGIPSDDDVELAVRWNIPGYILDEKGMKKYDGTPGGGSFPRMQRCGY